MHARAGDPCVAVSAPFPVPLTRRTERQTPLTATAVQAAHGRLGKSPCAALRRRAEERRSPPPLSSTNARDAGFYAARAVLRISLRRHCGRADGRPGGAHPSPGAKRTARQFLVAFTR